MLLSKKWLLEYTKPDVSDKAFADGMTMSGSKVEGFAPEGAELQNIVVGKILSLEQHPDADKLLVCQVDVAQDAPLQIVTGAQNLATGDIIPVALHNSVVAGGKKIKKGNLRGLKSAGMLCSLEELGLTTHDFPYAVEDGIFVLGDDCDKTLGQDIRMAIGLDDVVTEFEITSNRPDCLSILGLAREAAATFHTEWNVPAVSARPIGGEVDTLLRVKIDEPAACYRYAGAVVKNVRVAPSPRWMRERLRACGVRPINNIVDITNYVMLEFGQPMHAFDLRYLDAGQVIVRKAKAGESITTLDGVARTLDADMLVIADANKPVAVAGVMGGEYSGIMEDTSTIVFESACFHGAGVRVTAKKLGMRTEASSRYEKELDPQSCLTCLNRALDLVQLLDAGDIVPGVVDCNYAEDKHRKLPFDPDWVNRFIGMDVPAAAQQAMLESVGFCVTDGEITIPSYRNDVEHAADISEEVARLYGYDKIATRPLSGVAEARHTPEQLLERSVTQTLLAAGLSEIVTYSFISPKAYDKIALPKNHALRKSIVIANPLGEDTSVMRTTALPSMLDVLARNYNYRNPNAALFEVATVYRAVEGEEALPSEDKKIMLGMYGTDCDFFHIKGVMEALLAALHIPKWDITAVKDNEAFHPGRCARLWLAGNPFATFGEIHPTVLQNYGIGTRVYAASIDFSLLLQHQNTELSYRPLPKFPATTRDLAFVCDKEITVLTLEKAIAKAVGNTLEHIVLFDVYEGEQIQAGKKSVAFQLQLRSQERTLTDAETDAAMQRAIQALEGMGITLRS